MKIRGRVILLPVAALCLLAPAAWAEEEAALTVRLIGPPAANHTISLEESARQGDPLPLFIAGRKHLIDAANTGRTDWRDQGLSYIALAAEQGFTPAIRFIAGLYLDGQYVPRQPEVGITWLTRAAETGDPEAQRQLADLFKNGAGQVPPRPTEAVRWYEALLANKDADYTGSRMWEAEVSLAALYDGTPGITPNPVRTRELLEHASGSHDPLAQRALADMLSHNNDTKAALALYFEAARTALEHGDTFGLDGDASRHAALEILSRMERIDPKHHLTRVLTERLAIHENTTPDSRRPGTVLTHG